MTMIRYSTLRKPALSFPDVTEEPHFEKIFFRVNKNLFASYDALHHRACIQLSEIGQSVFCAYDASMIFPVPDKWGKQGWAFIDLKRVPKNRISDALKTAYIQVATSKNLLLRKNQHQKELREILKINLMPNLFFDMKKKIPRKFLLLIIKAFSFPEAEKPRKTTGFLLPT